MEQITGEIFQVGGDNLSHSMDASVYLVTSGDQAALVDSGTGLGHRRLMDNIRAMISDPKLVRYLFLTHCHFDHAGGASAIKDETGCSVVAHRGDIQYIESGNPVVTAASWYGKEMNPVRVDVPVETGGDFPLGDLVLHFIHAPGHSPGSSVILVQSEGKKVLFGQDVHGPLHPDLLSDRTLYHSSLAMLLSMDADILCEGHYGIIRGRDEVARFIRSFMP